MHKLIDTYVDLAYAQIDLKNARFYIRDGGNNDVKTGAVNNGAGYAIAATVLMVDGFTGAVETGGTFTIGANTYTITAHSETSSNTTGITIAAPGLIAAVADNAVITAYGKQESIEIVIGTGNMTFDETRNMEYTLNRGILDDVREGDQVPVDVSFQFTWDYIKGTGLVPSVSDALKKEGAASTWESSDTDSCKPYAVDLTVVYTPTCAGGVIETITLPDFRYEKLSFDPKAGSVSVSGKCNVTRATVVRV